MFVQDTICAVSTPAGEGGIGIIRLSGRDAIKVASRIFQPRGDRALEAAKTHTLHYGHIVDRSSQETVDEVLVSVMREPATYTREDIVEINCHGGMLPLRRTLALLVRSGARQAEPGEFTKRAFLNGRIDLAQAESVMDIIHSRTEMSHRAALEQLQGGLSAGIAGLRDQLISLIASLEAGIDFPEEDIETESGRTVAGEASRVLEGIEGLLSSSSFGRVLRDGFATAIVGRPNVGKSSLLNALLKQDRAIVTDIPGTTRDVIEEYLSVAGVPLKILDTAGIRHSHDVVEQEGVRRSLAAAGSADLVIIVLDGSRALTDEDRRVLDEVRGRRAVAVINKSDLPRLLETVEWPEVQVSLSCRTGEGISALKNAVTDMVNQGMTHARTHAWVVNERHTYALEQAGESLRRVLGSINGDLSPEFIAVDLRGALDSLGLIVGATYTEDILDRIFTKFCIGK